MDCLHLRALCLLAGGLTCHSAVSVFLVFHIVSSFSSISRLWRPSFTGPVLLGSAFSFTEHALWISRCFVGASATGIRHAIPSALVSG